MKWIREMLTGPDGDISSKRFWASVLICSGVAYEFILLFVKTQGVGGWQVGLSLIGSGAALLGVMAISKS